jgi:two-component system sensor histidine kinase RegB
MTSDLSPISGRSADPVGLTWLTLVRWTSILAGAGAVVAAERALEIALPLAGVAAVFSVWIATNVWLMWLVGRMRASVVLAGSLVLLDVLVLTGLLHVSGGILNPAAVFYLVQIVMSALVLGRFWTWLVTGFFVAGYASLYIVPAEGLNAAVTMHREIGLHMRGMWLAFALTALIVAVLVTRLAVAVERRDRALADLQESAARTSRAASLATLAAGAAHELGTPLSTIAVAARELEQRLAEAGSAPELQDDARLIRAETDRCRAVLEVMAGQSGQPVGEAARSVKIETVVDSVRARLCAPERDRLDVEFPSNLSLVWPLHVVSRAIANVVQNAFDASPPGARVRLEASVDEGTLLGILVIDRGAGMSRSDLLRAGEPFFTTKSAGKGTGLGIFVARSTVEQLGGRLTFLDSSERGTTARIVLPLDVVQPGNTTHA